MGDENTGKEKPVEKPEPDLLSVPLRDDSIPEAYRGKTAKELANALAASEQKNTEYAKAWEGLAQYGEHIARQKVQTESVQAPVQRAQATEILRQQLGDEGYQAWEQATAERYAPLAATLTLRAVQTEMEGIKQQLKNQYGEAVVGPIMDEWEKEIVGEVSRNPRSLETFVIPGTLRKAAEMKLGGNIAKITEAQQKHREAKAKEEKERETAESAVTGRGGRPTVLSPGMNRPRAEAARKSYAEDEVIAAHGFGFEPHEVDDSLGEFSEGPVVVQDYLNMKAARAAKK